MSSVYYSLTAYCTPCFGLKLPCPHFSKEMSGLGSRLLGWTPRFSKAVSSQGSRLSGQHEQRVGAVNAADMVIHLC